MNRYLRTVIVAPMTTSERRYPVRVPVTFGEKNGQVALDQIRAVDKARLGRHLGTLENKALQQISDILVEMFAMG
jgi:mRNA interferase MazF